MQVFSLKGRFARAASVAARAEAAEGGAEAAFRRDVLDRWHAARREGLTAGKAAKVVGVPKSTLFGWENLRKLNRLEPRSRRPLRLRRADWPKSLVRTVKEIRQDYPMWGKAKIAAAIRREWGGRKAPSASTIGRILASLLRAGDIVPVPALRRKAPRDARSLRPWARRKPADLKPEQPGGLLQVDSMTVTHRGGRRTIKQLVAADPVSKWTCAKAYRRATARNAADFLDKIVKEMPFKVKAIQVDGGSEFKAEFERECEKRGIDLWVLPPRSPKLNGNVERTVGTWRCEFHGCWDIPDDIDRINLLIDAFADEFNRVRPHRSLNCKTPEEFLRAAPDNGHPVTNIHSQKKQQTRGTERCAGKRTVPPATGTPAPQQPETKVETNKPTGYHPSRIEQEKRPRQSRM